MSGHKCNYSWDLQNRYAQDKSVVNKMQQKYWETKQAFIKATGKKEDEHVVASDADLDAKLELFHSVQRTCLDLSKAIVLYQKRICFLSQEENELGKFLRSQGFQDKTRAGKMMQAAGKALCFSSQQRLALRNPLCRFHQEVETFRHRAISDTWLTVNRMEQCRTEYRGALLWMKDVSQELDPDLYKQMEKFRKVQTQVRLAKKNFDKLKMDVCQKVDLLGASRCNLLSHMLATYQTTLLHFWEKTSHTMAAVHESFRGYQPYEFTTLKSLQDPMKTLVGKEERKINRQESTEAAVQEPSQLISLEDESQINESSSSKRPINELLDMKPEDGDKHTRHRVPMSNTVTIDDKPKEKRKERRNDFTQYIKSNSNKEKLLVSISWSSLHLASSYVVIACLDPKTGPPEPEGAEKDDLLLLSEIFNASSLEEGEFSKEWAAVFGEHRLKETAPTGPPGEPDSKPPTGSGFLPSQLLDQNLKDLQASLQEPAKASSDLTAWFSLFADLDPLSNPDAIGKTDKEHELLNA
ncbi:islet cell autoantigen 1 isoform 2-T5 [Thomomys bottae]